MSVTEARASDQMIELANERPWESQRAPAAPIRLQSSAGMPSRIAVVGNYLPRQCGIATFTTDCATRSPLSVARPSLRSRSMTWSPGMPTRSV